MTRMAIQNASSLAATRASVPALLTATTVGTFLEEREGYFQEVLPESSGMTARQFATMMTIAISRLEPDVRKKVLTCRPETILNSGIEAAQFGWRLGGSAPDAFLIPFGDACTLMPSYPGLLKLARNSGEFKAIEAVAVYAKDVFRVRRTPLVEILHEPCFGDDRGEMILAYAFTLGHDGTILGFEAMNKTDIAKAQQQSKSPGSAAWKNWKDQMWLRSVLKRLLKRQPRSAALVKALEIDDREFAAVALDSPQEHATTTAGRLKARLQPTPTTPSAAIEATHTQAEDASQDVPESLTCYQRIALARDSLHVEFQDIYRHLRERAERDGHATQPVPTTQSELLKLVEAIDGERPGWLDGALQNFAEERERDADELAGLPEREPGSDG